MQCKRETKAEVGAEIQLASLLLGSLLGPSFSALSHRAGFDFGSAVFGFTGSAAVFTLLDFSSYMNPYMCVYIYKHVQIPIYLLICVLFPSVSSAKM